MKLLRIISSMDPKSGGPCQGIRNAIPALKKLGVENEVVCLDDPSSSYIEKDPFVIYALEASQGPWGYSKQLIPWLLKNCNNYDVVIVHGLWQYCSYAAFRALRGKKSNASTQKIPYYVMPHGMLDPYFQKAPDRRIKAVRNWFYWKLIENKVVNESNGVLFTCEEELLLARKTFRPYHPKKELNIGYGIQAPPFFENQMTEVFRGSGKGLKNIPYFLFLSRIHPKKGLDMLIKAYGSWLRKIKENQRMQLVIAGPGLETSFGQELSAIVSEDELLKEYVVFTGMLSGNAKWGAFYGCEAFVLPSHQENFGIAIVEALACKKPVLISNKVNIWREIQIENAGFVEANTYQGTLNLLKKWGQLSDQDKKKMNINARTTFEKYYAIGPAAERFKNNFLNV